MKAVFPDHKEAAPPSVLYQIKKASTNSKHMSFVEVAIVDALSFAHPYDNNSLTWLNL